MRTKTCIVRSTPCEADKQTVGDGVRPQVPQHVRSAPIHLDVKRANRRLALLPELKESDGAQAALANDISRYRQVTLARPARSKTASNAQGMVSELQEWFSRCIKAASAAISHLAISSLSCPCCSSLTGNRAVNPRGRPSVPARDACTSKPCARQINSSGGTNCKFRHKKVPESNNLAEIFKKLLNAQIACIPSGPRETRK